jgi:hypothetical protein
MVSVKELKSVDLSSFTIVTTAIGVLFSIISSILIVIMMGVTTPSAIGASIYIISTVIVGTLMYTIYNSFCQGFLYNTLAKKINPIKLAFDGNKIIKVTTTETAIAIAMIETVMVILLYLASVVLMPLMINAAVQTLMYSGQQVLAYGLYQFMLLISQPATIAMIIFGTFIITFVFVLLGCYIYNILAGRGRCVEVELSQENNMTVIESIDYLKFAIVFAIINGILSIISAIVMIVSGGQPVNAILNIVLSFVIGFVSGALTAIFYNFIAPKLEKLKLELIDL